MGKRYQRGDEAVWKKRVRVFQFFSLTGPRDCVFLAERGTDPAICGPPSFLHALERISPSVSFHAATIRRNDVFRLTIPLDAPKDIFPSSFLTLSWSRDPPFRATILLDKPETKKYRKFLTTVTSRLCAFLIIIYSKRVLRSVYRTSINQFPRFLQFVTRLSNFYRVSFSTMISVIKKILDRSLEIPQQWKWLVLQFYKFVNPRLGIVDPDGLINPKMYYITWNFFRKKVIIILLRRIF